MIELAFSSAVAATPDTVWLRVCTMDGVNAELGPWIRMSHPADRSNLLDREVSLGEVLFRSWILLFGLLPLDRHALSLEALHERGFDERSTSWLQKIWIRQRRVVADGSGTRITDQLRFQPRIPIFSPLLRLTISLIFRHRHRQLARQFGLPRA